jgi:hypothetical protein
LEQGGTVDEAANWSRFYIKKVILPYFINGSTPCFENECKKENAPSVAVGKDAPKLTVTVGALMVRQLKVNVDMPLNVLTPY